MLHLANTMVSTAVRGARDSSSELSAKTSNTHAVKIIIALLTNDNATDVRHVATSDVCRLA